MKLTKEICDKMINLRMSNFTIIEISSKLNLSKTTVQRYFSSKKLFKRNDIDLMLDSLTNEELSYIAGIIDGEGSIIISKNNPNLKKEASIKYSFYVKVINTDRRLLEWLSVKTHTKYLSDTRCNPKPNTRNTFSIHWPTLTALHLLKLVYPYLVIKKEQVDVAVEFSSYKHIGGYGKLPDSILVERERLYLKMKELHKREWPLIT